MKLSFILAALLSSTVFAAENNHKACVDEATRKYDDCMELATETLANNIPGVTATAHSQSEAKALQQGGCKKLQEKDLSACPKS